MRIYWINQKTEILHQCSVQKSEKGLLHDNMDRLTESHVSKHNRNKLVYNINAHWIWAIDFLSYFPEKVQIAIKIVADEIIEKYLFDKEYQMASLNENMIYISDKMNNKKRGFPFNQLYKWTTVGCENHLLFVSIECYAI